MRSTQLIRGIRRAGLAVLFPIVPLLNWLVGGPAATVFAQYEGSGTRGGYLPSPPVQPQAAPATLLVRLTADALLEIEGNRTRSTGEVRRFVSPPLEVGKNYHYTLKATWREAGKEVTRKRVVPVRAGQEVVVDFHREESPRKNELPPKKVEEPQKK